jgi:hypothetical protein
MDSVMTPVDVDTSERVAEIGGLLAAALTRLQIGKSSDFAGEFGESSLHISPNQSGDAPTSSAEVSNG